MANRCMSLQRLCYTCVRLLSDTEKLPYWTFRIIRCVECTGIAVWVQASDLPVKVAESVSCMLLHGGNYYITGSWG